MSSEKTTATQLQELIDLVKEYLRQETADPLKTLGRKVGLGIGGSVLIGVSAVFFSIGILRLISKILPATRSGLLSMTPYIGVSVLLGLVCALLLFLMTRQK